MTNFPHFAAPTPHVATLPGDIDDGKSPETPVAQQESSNSMEVDAGSMSTTREVYATFFGPIPWKVTANILKTHLYISTWVSLLKIHHEHCTNKRILLVD